MEFVKMQGLGNDFVVVAGPVDITPDDVVAWCDRRRGIGADGVLEVSPVESSRVRMRYWNADGGEAEMCGNGLRCVARFAVERGWVDSRSFTVITAIGALPVRVNEDGTVRAYVGKPMNGESMTVAGVELHTVNMGNPHAISWVDDPASAPVETVGPVVEKAAVFPSGTNVEFAHVLDTSRIDLRVWERGIGETLACGTGAVATAFLAHDQGKVGSRVAMQLRGGVLDVEIDDDGAWMQGPAETVFRGNIEKLS
jgi:diaminopimelate epimerase